MTQNTLAHTTLPGCNRRRLLQLAAGISAMTPTLAPLLARDQQHTGKMQPIIDCNVSLFHWPFRRLPLDQTPQLLQRFHALGVNRAIAGSFEAILQRDLSAVNRRLAAECRTSEVLLPVAAINPAAPGWQQDLQLCTEELKMSGIRLLPPAHGYDLQHPHLKELFHTAAASNLFIQIVVSLEDPRTQPELFRTPEISLLPLVDLLRDTPLLRVQLLNARNSSSLTSILQQLPAVQTDIARCEGTDGVPRLVQQLPERQVVFGSHAPFLIPEAALIRTHESSLLSRDQIQQVLHTNAAAFLQEVRP